MSERLIKKDAKMLFAELYQICGALGCNEKILDNLHAASIGLKPPYKTLLPFIEEENNLHKKPTILKKADEKFESFKDYVLEKEREGRIVILTWDGVKEANIDDFIKQPAEGLLYDLNRDKVTILTYIEDQKWVNDYACMLVIKKLKESNKDKTEKPFRENEVGTNFTSAEDIANYFSKFDTGFAPQEFYKGLLKAINSLINNKKIEKNPWRKIKDIPSYKVKNPILLYTPKREFETDDNIVKGWFNWKDDSFHSDELLDEEIVEFTYWREMPEGPEGTIS